MLSGTLEKVVQAGVRHGVGESLSTIADTMDVSRETIWRWRREHSDIWLAAYEQGKQSRLLGIRFPTPVK